MFRVAINNYIIHNTKIFALIFSMATIIVISYISFLFQINNIDNVDATIIGSNTTITLTSNPTTLSPQNPVDIKTGQQIIPPSAQVTETDKIEGLTKKVADAVPKDDIVNPGNMQPTTQHKDNSTFANRFNVQQVELHIFGFPNNSLSQNLTQRLNIDPLLSSDSVFGTPTFNPFFRTCNQDAYDVAKGAITGELDNLQIKDNDFSLNIFADLINDDSKFDSKNYS
jgi:hypothetical protein